MSGSRSALWNLGFRPFYLLASVFAALSIPLWIAQYAGWLPPAYARGHTGHPLVADGFEVACFLLVQCAALLRVFGPLLVPEAYVATVIGSGACWSAAFALYAIRYWPVLTRPRLDGKPG